MLIISNFLTNFAERFRKSGLEILFLVAEQTAEHLGEKNKVFERPLQPFIANNRPNEITHCLILVFY